MKTEPVVTEYRADVTQLIGSLSRVSAEQAKLGSSVDALSKKLAEENSSLERSIARWAKIGATIGAAKLAYGFAKNAVDDYIKSGRASQAEQDKWSAATASLSEAFTDLKDSIARAVIDSAPAIEALAKTVGGLVSVLNEAGKGLADVGRYIGATARGTGYNETLDMAERYQQSKRAGLSDADWMAQEAELSRTYQNTEDQTEENRRNIEARAKADRDALLNTYASVLSGVVSNIGGSVTGGFRGYGNGRARAGGGRAEPIDPRSLLTFGVDQAGPYSAGVGSIGGLVPSGPMIANDNQARLDEILAQQQKADAAARGASFAEKTFGPIDDFYTYADAFNALTGAVTSSFGAWIDGQQSAGQALKSFFREQMKSLALEGAVRALREMAYGFSDLAFGLPTAAGHFKSAAMFGALAAAAGAGAHAMSGGGSAGGAGSAVGSRGGGSSGGGTTTNYFVLGDDHADDSYRKREQNARRIVELGSRRTNGYSRAA